MVANGRLCATRHLVMAIICTKQYLNPTTNNKVIAQKRMRGVTDERTVQRL